MDDHVSLESLFLDKTLEAHVALVGSYVGVDEDVSLHVGQQGELTTTDAALVLLHPFVSERVLFQVVRLDELHPTLAADVRTDVFVFHHVILKLTRILESLLAFCTPVQGGTTMDSQVPLQLGQRGEVQTTLNAHILLALFMLQLVRTKLTGIRKPSTTNAAAVRLDVTVLHHVSLQVAGLGEGLVANLTLVRPHALMCEQVCVQVAQLLEQLPTQVAAMWLDAIVAQDVCDKVVLGGVGLLTHPTLPALLVASDIHVVAVVHVNVEAKLLRAGRPASRRSVTGTGADVLSGVESTGGEVHDGPRHEEGVREEAVVETREVWRVEKERRWRPNRRRTERLLFHLHR